MNAFRFILASLRHFRRIHIAVALGVAVATAVLTGALLVGDSVRGSLRDLTLERLGRIDSVLVTGHMFRSALADELAADAEFKQYFDAAEPAILIAGTLQSGSGDELRRATRVSVIGCRDSFWSLGQGGMAKPLAENEVALTEPLAQELNVKTGDEIQLRIPTSKAIPADSPLGEKEDTSNLGRFRVGAVLPPRGLARFSLAPSQHLPRSVFVPLAELQALLDKPDKANAILVAGPEANRASNVAAEQALQAALTPMLVDYGLKIEPLSAPLQAIQIAADQLVLANEVVSAAERAFPNTDLQPVVTYLANTISVGEGSDIRKITYSTITGVDSTAELGPLLDESGQPIVLANDEIALNRWAADDLGAKVGDVVAITFYEPESTHGQLRERQPPPKFKLRAIVDLEDADGNPTRAADQKLTPDLPGVTDQKSIADWDLPFELVEKIRPQDEDYWDKYRTTPKAFVSLATAKRLWESRWGTISLLRVGESLRDSHPNLSIGEVRLLAELKPADVGMTFLPVKAQGLAAASGTTPFDALFLGFSMFLIAAAVMLIALLFQLGIQQRAAELGTLAAVGVDRKRIAALLSREGLIVAAIGALVGVAAGVGYAWLMIVGLRTWWIAAISTPFLELHVTPRSLILGWLIGVVVSWLTIRWSIRQMVRTPANRLLHGETAAATRSASRKQAVFWPLLRILFAVATIALVALGFKLNGEAQAGAFFGSGALVLALLLGEIRHRLRTAIRGASGMRKFTLTQLSILNTARNPTRSTLTVGLVAAATFLIVAISAFRLDTGAGGTGGFDLIATSDQPIYYDLNTPEGRLELGFDDRADRQMQNWRVYSLRVAAGEDASCLNLYRPSQPRVLGVPIDFVARGGFDWAATNEADAVLEGNPGASAIYERFFREPQKYPWRGLGADVGKDERGRPIVPVVLDASTAAYSLHLKGVGSRLTIRDAADEPVTLQVVGLLKNSILQGNLLVSEDYFLQMFPDTGGYRYFLIEQVGPPSRGGQNTASSNASATRPVPLGSRHLLAAEVAQLLESTLAGDGFDATDANEQLAGFLAVQNTYLSTFQSLGALGLLLGTIGLAVVQLRSVLERHGELALMRATGFRRDRLVWMVVLENAALLVGGLLVGSIAAAVALIPQWSSRQASVPWVILAALLGTIAIVGLVAGWLATRSALRAPLVPALRGE